VSKQIMRGCAIVALITSGILVAACNPDASAPPPAATPAAATSNPTGPPNKPGNTYYGAIDTRGCDTVAGWVYNSVNPKEEINVALYIDDKQIEVAPARTLREDVKAQGIATGEYGFSFKLPDSFKDGKPHTISAKTVGSDYTLINIPNVSPFKCP